MAALDNPPLRGGGGAFKAAPSSQGGGGVQGGHFLPFFSIHRPGQPKHAKLVHREIFLKQKDTVMVPLGNLDV